MFLVGFTTLWLTRRLTRTRKSIAPVSLNVTWPPIFGKSKLGIRGNGNIGVMLKAIVTIAGKFSYPDIQLFEVVLSGAKLKVNSNQFCRSFCFVHSVKPKFQSTIALSRETKQHQSSVHPLPSLNGFVSLVASIFKSGRVTSGLCRMSCYAGHLTAWR